MLLGLIMNKTVVTKLIMCVYIMIGFNFFPGRLFKTNTWNQFSENIDPGLHFAFEVMNDWDWNPLGYAYDIHSGLFFFLF